MFIGPTVADVIKQYWKVIGAPGRIPYWGLGHFYGSEKISSQGELLKLMQSNHTKLGALPVEGLRFIILLFNEFFQLKNRK